MCYMGNSVAISVTFSDVRFLKWRTVLSKVLNNTKYITPYCIPRFCVYADLGEKHVVLTREMESDFSLEGTYSGCWKAIHRGCGTFLDQAGPSLYISDRDPPNTTGDPQLSSDYQDSPRGYPERPWGGLLPSGRL